MYKRQSQSDFEGKFANSSSLQRIGVDEVSSENREELAQKLQRDTAVQLAYLKAQGEKVEPIYRTEKEQFDSLGNDSLEKIIEYAGADELKKVFEGGDFDLMDKLADKAADALEEKYTHGSLEGQNRRWQMRINKLRNENRGRLYGLLEHAYKMMTDTSNGKVELDVEATREAIRQAAPEAAVKNWVKEQLGSVLGQKGIRNSKDRFTPGGKRRSFTELHNPYTLENLVAAMNDQNARGQDVWGLSASTLMSTTTAEYKNLDEVRADKGRLQQMPEEEYKALLKKAAALDIRTICPLHGPVLTGDLGKYLNYYDIWSSYKPEEPEKILVASASIHGHTRAAAHLMAEKLRAKGAKVVEMDLTRTDVSYAVTEAFRCGKIVLACATYDGFLFPPMENLLTHLKTKSFQNRTVGLMENGTWAPMAAKLMRAELEGMKNITVCENVVTIRSAANAAAEAQMDALAAEITEK